MKNKFLKNSVIYTITDLIIKSSSFLLLPFYTKKIPATEMGEIYTLLAFGGILTTFYSLSLRSAITRFYNEEKENITTLFSSIVNFSFIFGLIVNILIILNKSLFKYFLKMDFFPSIFLIILSSFLTIFYNYIYTLLIMKEDAKKISTISIINSIMNIFLTIYLIEFMKNKKLAYLLAMLITAANQFIIFLFMSNKYYKLKVLEKKALVKYLNYSLRILPFDLSGWILTFSDRFFLTEYIDFKATGIYSVGYKVGQAIDIVIMNINKTFVPYIYQIFHNNTEKSEKNLSKMVTKILTVEIFLTCAFISLFKSIIFILGKDYEKSFLVVMIISFSVLINGGRLVFQPILDYKIELLKLKLIIWITSSILNIILNIYLIPKYSYIGASIATLISYIYMFLAILYFSLKNYEIKYEWNKIVFIFFVNIFMLMLSLSININFYIDITLKSLIFFSVLLYLKRFLNINIIRGEQK